MRNIQKVVAVFALSALCLAAPAPSDSGPAKTKHHAAKPAKRDETAEQLRQLKQMVEQQQATMQQLQQQLQQTQQQLQETQQQLTQTTQTAQQADAKVAAVENTGLQVQKVSSDLADVKGALNTTNETVQKNEKRVAELEHPNSVAYKGVRITPGGFIELTGIYRSKATVSDQATPFNAIPLANQPNTKLSEFGFTARDSRIILRADADAGTTKLTGYFEMDFFGTSTTANPNQTTSYTPRIRQGWGRAKFANGWTVTGGQMWNLITLNRKGTDADNANLWIPNIIEAQYSVGYDWGRFAELRVSKTVAKDVNIAVGLANPSYLNSGATAAVAGLATPGVGLYGNTVVTTCTLSSPVTAGATQTCTQTPLYSINLSPDIVAKIAYDTPKGGHLEVKGLTRIFRDRVVPTATTHGFNNTALGYGAGAGAIIPIRPKKVDFVVQGLWGKGVSRYEDSGQFDFVVRSNPATTATTRYSGGDNDMQPIMSYSVLGGFETHPSKKVEIDALFGDEYYYKTTYTLTATTIATGATAPFVAGYGAPTAQNTGCFYETQAAYNAATGTATALPACTGNNRNLWNAKLYGYYDVYKGPMGTLRYGAEVDYISRRTYTGIGGAPRGNTTTVFTTMRYIFP